MVCGSAYIYKIKFKSFAANIKKKKSGDSKHVLRVFVCDDLSVTNSALFYIYKCL